MSDEDEEAALAEQIARHAAAYADLRRATRGATPVEAERLVRDFAATYAHGVPDVSLVLTARVISEPQWARRHPLAALALAWRYRHERPPLQTLRWLRRPTFVG